MKTLAFALLLILPFSVANSQVAGKTLRKVLELKMPGETGANGASVTWHPTLKRYYAAMAGNTTYPLGVFAITGKLLSPADQATLFDIRGLWYNANTNTLQMNGYKEHGWAEYKLNSSGFPEDIRQLFGAMIQPTEQSSGAFNAKENALYFFNDDGNIEKYSVKAGIYIDEAKLALGKTSEEDNPSVTNYDMIGYYNPSTVVYTGNAGQEIGLLNYDVRQIELYNLKTGLLATVLALPEDAPVPAFLNFSYCNGIYWLFDKTARTWKGYK